MRCAKRLGLVALASLLCGCEAHLPARIEVVSVTAFRTDDPGEAMPWYAARSDRPAIRLLRVALRADRDLFEYARQHGSTVVSSAYGCDEQAALGQQVWAPPYLMVGEHPIDGVSEASKSFTDQAREAPGRFAYAIVLPLGEPPFQAIYDETTRKSNVRLPLHDIHGGHSDLCFQIHGGQMWTGWRYTSATIRVPRAAILLAIEHST